jgi:hypothetical protein
MQLSLKLAQYKQQCKSKLADCKVNVGLFKSCIGVCKYNNLNTSFKFQWIHAKFPFTFIFAPDNSCMWLKYVGLYDYLLIKIE